MTSSHLYNGECLYDRAELKKKPTTLHPKLVHVLMRSAQPAAVSVLSGSNSNVCLTLGSNTTSTTCTIIIGTAA